MSPDFSNSPEHVALANAMVDTLDDNKRWASVLGYEDIYRMADAAITHLGSGFRLPEATEANAERLAKAKWAEDYPDLGWGAYSSALQRRLRIADTLKHLRALHAAFGEPEKPQQCNCADCSPANWPDTNGWRCGKKKPEPRPYPPGPTPCGEAKFIPPLGARPDGSLVTHTVPTPSRACPATCGDHRCKLDAGHEEQHEDERIAWEDEAQPEKPRIDIIPRRVLFTALASNSRLVEVLMDMERREDRVACIQRWASIFEEAACRK